MKKILTLCIIHKDNQVLLGMKKRGFGMGKWNGFGGKLNPGETVEEAAKRELFEEADIESGEMEKMGLINFVWENNLDEIWEVNIFKLTEFIGEPKETEEMKPRWFDMNEIPFEKMWPDDKYWLPLFLENKKFKGKFKLSAQNNIIEHQLEEI